MTLNELLTKATALVDAVTSDESADDAAVEALKTQVATLTTELEAAKANAADPAVLQQISDALDAANAKLHPPAA